jgi:hypothetical protein
VTAINFSAKQLIDNIISTKVFSAILHVFIFAPMATMGLLNDVIVIIIRLN